MCLFFLNNLEQLMENREKFVVNLSISYKQSLFVCLCMRLLVKLKGMMVSYAFVVVSLKLVTSSLSNHRNPSSSSDLIRIHTL